MIAIKRITTPNSNEYRFMENLLVTSFPPEEYRDLEKQREYTSKHPRFFNNVIEEDGKPVGLISYWELDDFIYIEHFAIDPGCRNGGYGKRVLEKLQQQLQRNIVLEVELPEGEMAIRRIGFYQRLGYELWEKDYIQPPYREGYPELPLRLMVKGNLESNKDFRKVRDKIHTEVYGTKKAAL